MIDLVDFILKYGIENNGKFHIEIVDNMDTIYRSAHFGLEHDAQGRIRLYIDIFNNIEKNSLVNRFATVEPIHECNFLIQNVDLILVLFIANHQHKPNIHFKNCILNPSSIHVFSNFTNCIEREIT